MEWLLLVVIIGLGIAAVLWIPAAVLSFLAIVCVKELLFGRRT